MRAPLFRLMMNLYPPFLGAGIRVKRVTSDYREIDVEMGLHFYNRNFVGTHFGGNLLAMTDPFYMLMLIPILGRDFLVWDKYGTIDFVKPGTGRVRAEFRITDEVLEQIEAATADGDKYLPTFTVEVRDEQDETVAVVERTVYIRRKQNGPTER